MRFVIITQTVKLCWDTFPIAHVDFILMLQIVWKKFTYENRLSSRTYISKDKNPVDAGTRFSSSPDMTLVNSWNTGPTWILSHKSNDSDENCYLLVSPNDDNEIRSEIVFLKFVHK